MKRYLTLRVELYRSESGPGYTLAIDKRAPGSSRYTCVELVESENHMVDNEAVTILESLQDQMMEVLGEAGYGAGYLSFCGSEPF